MFLKSYKLTNPIRLFVWVVIIIVYSTSTTGKEVVDFRSVTAKKHSVSDVEFANLDSLGNREFVLIENGYAGNLEYAVSISE